MNFPIRAGWRERLRNEACTFPWKDVLPRMALDFVLVNASVLMAFVLRFLYDVAIIHVEQPWVIAESFKRFFIAYWLFWSSLAILVFYLSGFYTHTRSYASRHKAWVIFRSVSLLIVLFVFADYLLFRSQLVPRGVAMWAWFFMLLSVGGVRFTKDMFLKRYVVEPKPRPDKVKQVLVVGGGGYLGSVLVRQLLARGFRLRVFDAFLYGTKAVDDLRDDPRLELVSGDLRDIESVVKAMRSCDAVIHLAAIVGDPACEENKEVAIEINRVATRMLVDIARGYGVSRFLFASTCSVYGASDFLMDERTALSPLSIYAQTKADSEAIVLSAKAADFHPTVLRLGTLFGLSPRVRFDLAVNLLVLKAATTGKITIFNGEQWRPFIHVHDAARAFIKVMEANPAVVSGEIYNVGDYNLNHQLEDVGQAIKRVILEVEIGQVQNEDRRNYRVSFDKIHSRLGFICEKSVEDGVREVYELIRSEQIPAADDGQASNHIFLRNAGLKKRELENAIRLLETAREW